MNRYWILTTEFPPFSGGGISTYCHHTSQKFASAGYSVTVFIPNTDITNYKILNTNQIRLVYFNYNQYTHSPSLGYNAKLSYGFAKIVTHFVEKEGSPDIIESQDYLGIAYYLQQFKLTDIVDLQRTPIVITLHSPAFLYFEANRIPIYKFPNFWICEMEKNSIASADYLISPTIYLKNLITERIQLSLSKISVIVNPYITLQETKKLNFTRNKIIFYGKLSRQKGTFKLLEFLKEMWDEGFPHPLTIVGGTDIVYHPEMRTMEQIVKDKYAYYYKKGLLQFFGKIKSNQLTEVLSDAHVIIFPSIIDNLPYSIIESMALGKIVLASLEGGQREIIEDGIDGFTYSNENQGEFKLKINHILSLSTEEVNRIGNRAVQKVRSQYNPEMVYSAKHSLFYKLINEKNATHTFPFLYSEHTPQLLNKFNNELLSVIIPHYNLGNFLSEAIASVKSSTYQQIEIIIINDGSTETKSIDLLNNLKNEKNIKIISQKNSGVAKARNAGAKAASGKYIAFLDSDDKVHEKYYEKCIKVLKKYDNVFFVGTWVQYFGDSKSQWATITPQPPYILVHNSINSSGLVYKKEAFLNAGMNDHYVDYGLEDYESVINMISNGYMGIIIPEALFFYRVRRDSMYRKINTTKFLHSYRYISDKHSSFFRKYATETINLLNANGPGFLYDNPTLETEVSIKVRNENRIIISLKRLASRNKFLKNTLITLKNKFKL